MSLQNRSLGSKNSDDKKLWQTLDRIQNALSLEAFEMAHLMQLQEREFNNLKKNQKVPLVSAIFPLSGAINLGFESLMKGEVDYIALKKHFRGVNTYLPKKYAIHAYSRRRTSINLLNFIGKNFGLEKRAQILKSFQMTEAMFIDPMAFISIRFPIDICEWIYRFYKNDHLLIQMGMNSFNTYSDSPIGHILSRSNSLDQSFETMFNGLISIYLEQNFIWNIFSLKNSTCKIIGSPSQHLKETIETEYVNNRSACLIRTGFISTIPCYSGYRAIDVKKNSCVSQGDSFCTFEVDFGHIHQIKNMARS